MKCLPCTRNTFKKPIDFAPPKQGLSKKKQKSSYKGDRDEDNTLHS